MVASPSKRTAAAVHFQSRVPRASVQAAAVYGGGDSAAGPLVRHRPAAVPQASAQLRAISLEYTHQELTTATSGWHASRKLGSGCYGAVYRGELKDGSVVAIKVIDLAAVMGKGENAEDAGFDEEVQMLSKFRHPNLVTLLGWGQQGLSRYLVYEFLAGGDVFQRLHRSRSHGGAKLFHWYERLSALQDAATGLSHMHNSTPKAFHRDIKSANILLDRHGTAKMADFGLSCTSGQTGAQHITVKTISGTPGYKCPIYERSGRFTEGSEVYSFGMVTLEVVTGLDPSAADPSAPGGIAFPVAETIKPTSAGAIDRVMRHLDFSANWPAPLAQELATLALRTVSGFDDRQRPQFVEMVRALRNMGERFPKEWAQQQQQQQPSQPQPAAPPQAAKPAAPPAPQPQRGPARLALPGGALAAGGGGATAWGARTPQGRAASVASPSAAVAVAVAQPQAQAAAVTQAGRLPSPAPAGGEVTPSLRSAGARQVSLEFVRSSCRDAESLPAELRVMSLAPSMATTEGGRLTWSIGRNPQREQFEAWLPDVGSFSCISRKAIDISWSPGSADFYVMVCAVNPLSIDGEVVTKGGCVTIKSGSEICFTYEQKVLLHLRLRCAAVAPEAGACPQLTNASTSTGSGGSGGQSAAAAASANSALAAGGSAAISGGEDGLSPTQPGGVPPQAAALAAASSAPAPGPSWALERCMLLEGTASRYAAAGAMLEGVGSVSGAVEALNSGLRASSQPGFCIVHSPAKASCFLLYQPGKRDTAIKQLGLSIPSAGSPIRSRGASAVAWAQVELAAKEAPTSMTKTVSDAPSTEDFGTSGRVGATRSLPAGEAVARRWRLQCIHGEGIAPEELAAMPAEMREVQLVPGTNLIGRHHQPCNFEHWLPDQLCRYCVSRTSIQIITGAHGLHITNMSSNTLYIDREGLAKGESRHVAQGQVLSFARTEAAGSFTHFLMLQVRVSEHARDAAVGCASPSRSPDSKASASTSSRSPTKHRTVGAMPAAGVMAATDSLNARGNAKAVTLPSPQSPREHLQADSWRARSPVEDAGGHEMASMEQTVTTRPPRTRASGAYAPAVAVACSQVELELCGSGALDVPTWQRSLSKQLGDGALVVGRRFQPELHSVAVRPDIFELLDRHEWCIAFEGGQFVLMALSDVVSMWRGRQGEFEPLSCEKVLPLEQGDRILLGCGGVASPLEAQLVWAFSCTAGPAS